MKVILTYNRSILKGTAICSFVSFRVKILTVTSAAYKTRLAITIPLNDSFLLKSYFKT